MTKLSNTEALILHAAAKRPAHVALPLPAALRGGAAIKVVGAMLAKGLLVEIDVARCPDAPVWSDSDDTRSRTLVATDEGLAAIEVQSDAANSAPTWAKKAPDVDPALLTPSDAGSAPKTRTPRAGTKQAGLVIMLRAPEGATVPEIALATGWQPHTVRGAMAGALKKTLGLAVTSERVVGRGRVYRLPAS